MTTRNSPLPSRRLGTGRRTGTGVLAIVPLALLLAGTPPASSATPHHDASSSEAGELLDFDAYAHGNVVDLLLTVESPAGIALLHRRSRDGGLTWSEELPVDLEGRAVHPPGRGAGPQIAAHRDTVLVLWTRPGDGFMGSGPLTAARSTDGGASWHAAADPADDGTTAGHAFADVAVDAQGRFHAVWLDGRDGGQGLRHSSTADGTSWQPNRTIDARTCECCWNRLLSGSAGHAREALVLFRDKDPRDMSLARSTDGGGSWVLEGRVGAFDWAIDGCPHVGGGLARGGDQDELFATVWTGEEEHVGAWLLRRRADAAWSEPTRLGGRTARHTDVAASARLVWTIWDERLDDGSAVLVATSSDGGESFGEPRRLSAPGVPASHPRVLATAGGALALWSERGENGGTTWSHAVLGSAAVPTRAAPATSASGR